MKKVIVTGAGGFVGSEIVRKMIQHAVSVIAISRNFNDAFPNSPLVTKIVSEISDINSLLSILPKDDYDAFYHFAWIGVNGIQKADPLVQIDNLKIAINCANAAKQIGCKKFLCAGTIAENAFNSLPHIYKTNGGMVYGIAKYCSHIMLETYCKNICQEFIWMQFSNIYGPQNKTGNLISYTLGELLQGKEATFGTASQPYDFIFIDDLLEAVYRLGFYKTKRNFYVISSGTPRILKEYLHEIGIVCKKPELIKIGVRSDDGIVYTFDMFDNSDLLTDIGSYVSKQFSEGIRYTIENYRIE